MNNFYFTFGSNHVTSDGASLGQHYVKITAESEGEARDQMAQARGLKWSFSYPEEHFADQPAKYGLREVSLEDVELPNAEN